MAVTPPAQHLSGPRPPSRLRLAGLVALGGAVGVLVRAGIENLFPAPSGTWPWATFWINVTGSLLLGALLETLVRSGPDEGVRRTVRVVAGTGVLGGYTTYSSFAVETVHLADGGHADLGITYALVSVVLGVVAAAAGIRLAAAAHCRRRAAGGRS